MKKSIVAIIPALAAGAALAEGQAVSFDLSAATTAATNMGTAVSGLFTSGILPAVSTVVAASLAVWGLFVVVRWIRKAGR